MPKDPLNIAIVNNSSQDALRLVRKTSNTSSLAAGFVLPSAGANTIASGSSQASVCTADKVGDVNCRVLLWPTSSQPGDAYDAGVLLDGTSGKELDGVDGDSFDVDWNHKTQTLTITDGSGGNGGGGGGKGKLARFWKKYKTYIGYGSAAVVLLVIVMVVMSVMKKRGGGGALPFTA